MNHAKCTQVLFEDQYGHNVAHNPETLEVTERRDAD